MVAEPSEPTGSPRRWGSSGPTPDPELTAALAAAIGVAWGGRIASARPAGRAAPTAGAELGAAGRGAVDLRERRRWWRSAQRLGLAVAAVLVVAEAAAARHGGRDRGGPAGLGSAASALCSSATRPSRGSARWPERCARSDRELVGEVVDAVLQRLEPAGERAQALLEPLDVGGRGEVERADRRRCAEAARSPAPRARDRGPN